MMAQISARSCTIFVRVYFGIGAATFAALAQRTTVVLGGGESVTVGESCPS